MQKEFLWSHMILSREFLWNSISYKNVSPDSLCPSRDSKRDPPKSLPLTSVHCTDFKYFTCCRSRCNVLSWMRFSILHTTYRRLISPVLQFKFKPRFHWRFKAADSVYFLTDGEIISVTISAELATRDVFLLRNPPNCFCGLLVLIFSGYRLFILRANTARAWSWLFTSI
jgi:hypothetical protein